MTIYSDQMASIKKARAERDVAREDLYKTKLLSFGLIKDQKKFTNKEMVADKAVASEITSIRNEMADLQNQLNVVITQLQLIQNISNQINVNTAQQNALSTDISRLQEQIADIDSQLSDQSLSQTTRNKLEARKKALQAQRAAEQAKISNLKRQALDLKKQLSKLQEKEESLNQQKQKLQSRLDELQKELKVLISKGQKFSPDKSLDLSSAKDLLSSQIAQLNNKNINVRSFIEGLYDGNLPQTLIEKWVDNIPIMLFPVRIETKYHTAGGTNQLWIRIFPDDISVVTHETLLTQHENDAGRLHWKTLWLAHGDTIKKKASWTLLSDNFGINRAAWIAIQTKPVNWSVEGTLESENDLEFPANEVTKPSTWTQAPHTRIMPDKFVIQGYSGGALICSKVGNQINDILTLGPSPLEDGENPSITRTIDEKIQYGDDFKWLVDFDIAIQNGLGFIITDKDLAKGNTITNGFDRLVALGLKLSSDQNDGKQLVEDLLINHNYSTKGLSLIKQGTPTNNTEEKDAGYSKKGSIDSLSEIIEKGTSISKYPEERNTYTDGQRLAEYLGIDYNKLQLVPNIDKMENEEAVAMNKALYASTLGYYLNSMLNDVMSNNSMIQLRDHFANYVTGRGPISAIRVGNQPYGIIPTSAFSRWKYGKAGIVFENSGYDFYNRMYSILSFLQSVWQKLVPQLSYIHKDGDSGANLMNVLGLNPTSVEFFQRVGYSMDYLQNLEKFSWGGRYFSDIFKTILDQIYVKQIMKNLGYTDKKGDNSAKPVPLLLQLVFQHYHTRLDNNNLIDGLPFSEETKIKPYSEKLNFIDWLLTNISNSTIIENQDFGGVTPPHSLLYMMLKNSLLLETSHSLYRYFIKNNIEANELVRSRKFMNVTSSPSVSHWEVFQTPVNKVVSTETSALPLFEFIHSKQFAGPAGMGIVDNIDDIKWALGILKDMSTSSLERAMAEHLDTLTYRLDAWQTSLFDIRIQQQRKANDGIYIGAYGYLENVKPSTNRRTKISEQSIPGSLRENKDNLYTEFNNGGYVHAPSLNHATAAAILRSGYLTHASPDDKELLSVNLSSERVRRAKYLIEGIRNGQTLEVLLGYQFERGLHDYSTRPVNPVILNQLIPEFRKAFPIKKTKIPQEGKVTGPEEVIEDFSAVNGLTLAQITTDSPFGITPVPALSTVQINTLRIIKDNIANTLDALRDILTSESAYQLALGNFDRAAAVMQAISDSHMPPDIQVIDSARGTDLSFTNKVGIHFDSSLTASPWTGVLMTQKAITESGLNNWMGSLMGIPANIRCLSKAIDKDGNVLKRSDNSLIQDFISLWDLKIQAIDFVYLIRNRLESSGTSELEARIHYFFAKKNGLSDDIIVKIEFSQTDDPGNPSIKSFAEILPFANYIRDLVSGSRALRARDYDSFSKKVTTLSDNPDNINLPDLQTRVQNTFDSFSALIVQLQTALSDALAIKSEPVVNILRDTLKAIADAGLVFTFPQSANGFDAAQLDVLSVQGQSVIDRFTSITAVYNDNLALVNNINTGIGEKTNLLTGMIKTMLGDDFVILPRFSFHDVTEIAQVYATRNDLLKYSHDNLKVSLPVSEWLHGVSLVRTKMHTFEFIRLLNDTFNVDVFQLDPMQIPYRDNSSWLAVEYPPDTTIDHDSISFISYNPQGFIPSNDQCGLLIDEWAEVIPNKEEVTGISFNYNQPNSVPPQAVLLAVTPEETGSWKWDNLTETILDTFDRAKRRAVEPDLLDQQVGMSTLLPALISEFSTSKSSISLDYSLNIQYIAEQVSVLQLNNK